MRIFEQKNISKKKLDAILLRPAFNYKNVERIAFKILGDIKKNGYKSAVNYAMKYDGIKNDKLLIPKSEISKAAKKISPELKRSIAQAAANIKKFHLLQKPNSYSVSTMPGVKCSRKFYPIANIGLYIPGGSAVLFSTMLMLGIAAKIAGVKRIVACSPIGSQEIDPALAFAAQLIGVDEFYNIGGAQAIGMMAYGSGIDKVDKIFGPGNQYVTAAKSLVSIEHEGCAIDMPAGPSEVLIIADDSANPKFVAADLLSQAEHGTDSQVILLTTDKLFALEVLKEVTNQLIELPRKEIAEKSLSKSSAIIVNNMHEAIKISNKYAPEHLIVSTRDEKKIIDKITNAGSVFIGSYSPESVGDYASGTNHSLPTYGYSKSYSGVSVESFLKAITFQKLSKKGLKNISKTVITMAEAEKLKAHANAVKIRMNKYD